MSASDGQYLALAKWDTPRVVKGVRFQSAPDQWQW
ncbi:phage tail tip protein J-related protein [Escherichia coli]